MGSVSLANWFISYDWLRNSRMRNKVYLIYQHIKPSILSCHSSISYLTSSSFAWGFNDDAYRQYIDQLNKFEKSF